MKQLVSILEKKFWGCNELGNLNALIYNGYEFDENYKENIRVQWHLTVECDQRCKHCYMFVDDKYEPQKNNQLTTQQSFSLIDDLYLFLKKARIHGNIFLTGGDPILSHNFWDVLNYIQQYNRVLTLDTIMGNSYHIDDSVAEKLRSLGITDYQISLDGLKETHDDIRKPGSFDDALRAFKCLHKAGIRTAVMATVHEDNCDEIIELYQYLNKLEYIDIFVFDRMMPIGNGKTILGDSLLDGNRLKEMLHNMIQYETIKNERKILGYKSCVSLWKPSFYELGLTNPLDKNAKKYYGTCFAGGGSFSLLSDGTILACRRLDIVAGKYPEDDLKDVLINSPLFKEIRNPTKETSCPCLLQYNCNGCPAMKFAINGTMSGKDPHCWRGH